MYTLLLLLAAAGAEFTEVQVSGPVRVVLDHAASAAVKTVPAGVSLTFAHGVLVVDAADADEAATDVVVQFTVLQRVTAQRGARVTITGATGKELAVTAHDSSRITATGKVAALHVVADGTARVDAARLIASDVTVELSKAARAQIDARDTLTAQLIGASQCQLQGTPKHINRSVSGAARLMTPTVAGEQRR